MPENIRHTIPCDELRNLRINHNMTFEQLAIHYKCGTTSIQRRCHDCGIQKRQGVTAAQVAQRANLDAIRLRELYVDKLLSEKEVGEIMGCDQRTVRQELQRYNIKLRPRGGAPPRKTDGLTDDVLYRLAITEKKSDGKIGKMFGVSSSTVAQRRLRCGIHRPKSNMDEILTREYLETEFGKKRRSVDNITQETGFSNSAVYARLRKFGIPLHEDRSPEYTAYVRQCYKNGKKAQERMFDLLGGICAICETAEFKQHHIHHMYYVPNDVIYGNYKGKPSGLYHIDLLPLVEKDTERFRLLCQSCHFAVGKLETVYKHGNLNRFLDIITKMDKKRAKYTTTFSDCIGGFKAIRSPPPR